jgi:putative phosphoribosyl transferase
MKTQFRNRTEAGELLAGKLTKYANRRDVLVLGLPRGGVPVASIVAQRLHAPLDVLIVRKLGVPGQEELAMGAVATGGVRVLNPRVIEMLGIPDSAIDVAIAREQAELERREQRYRSGRPMPAIRGRTVILVDDGIATGSTVRAAISVLRHHRARRIVVATPTISAATHREMRNEANEIVAVLVPEDFFGVGQFYVDFSQTTDEEVQALLTSAASPAPGRGPRD